MPDYSLYMNKRQLFSFLLSVSITVLGQMTFIDGASAACNTTTRTDSFGRTTTSGSCDGQRVSTTSRTDSFGRTTTSGTVGDNRISTTSRTDSFGRTTTSGTVGNSRISTTTRTDSFGRTTKSCP